MEFERIEGRRKGSTLFCADGYIYTKNNEYKGKVNLRCAAYKKNCTGTAYIDVGMLFTNKPHNHPRNFEEVEKIKVEARIKKQSESLTKTHRDIYNENTQASNVEIRSFAKISSVMRKRRANSFPKVLNKPEDFLLWF